MVNACGTDLDVTDFVSHSWLELVKQMLAELRTHQERLWQKRKQKSFAICFLANPQTWPAEDLARFLGVTPFQSTFARALAQAEEVVAIHNKFVHLYTRLWCVFELFEAHT